MVSVAWGVPEGGMCMLIWQHALCLAHNHVQTVGPTFAHMADGQTH